MKVRMWSDGGFVGGGREEFLDVDDDMSDEEIEEVVKDWFWNYHEYGFEKLDEKK